MNKLLKIGSIIKYGGKSWTIGSVMFIGERYYGLVDASGAVALVPAAILEA